MQFYKAFYTFAFHQSSAHWSESTGLLKLLSPTWGQRGGAKKEGDTERQSENEQEKKKKEKKNPSSRHGCVEDSQRN